ncbi:maleylpyruvate isomerase family mycothiol-dependent enzyme [Nocardioides solisilvae]|uniref:maleylpyruvate isomerase family mycothiol-dependent enzyme n=1 Tax=Nocardioides solisilvae TaxID=1542435 RepID=UPI000D7443C5|nr:maleylpyruvate isomerase family mycothiol-dependent enzyme [Nocardioides solisilvae]
MALPTDPAARHRVVADRFTGLVRGTTDWSAPAPVEGWTALDVVDHLVTWLPGFLAGGTDRGWQAGPPVAEDPVAAWEAHVAGVQGLLDDPEAAASPFRHPHVPPQDLASALTRFWTADVFMHSWDLARATGQDDTLDAEECAATLAGMEAMEDVIRSSGQFGERQPVADDAGPQDRLVAFIGRDPGWRPPGD